MDRLKDDFIIFEKPNLFYDPKDKEKGGFFKNRKAWLGVLAGVLFVVFVPFNFSVRGIAKVEAENDVVIEALVSGELFELDVKEGDKVRKGQKLGALYDRGNEQELVKSKNDLAVIQKELGLAKDKAKFLATRLERNSALYDSDAITANEKESAEFEHHELLQTVSILETKEKSIVSKIHFLSKAKDMGRVVSPLDGIVVNKVEDKQATYFEKGDEIFKVADMSNIVLEMPVYENQLRRIKEGSPAKLKFLAYPDKVFKGKVVGIHHSAYEKVEKVWVKENVINVRIRVEDPIPFVARAGMTAKVLVGAKGESLFSKLAAMFLF